MIEELQKHSTSAVWLIPCIRQEKEYDLKEIIEETCKVFNVRREQLNKIRGKSRKDQMARWIIWKIMRSHNRLMTECGSVTGHHYSTVIHSLKNIDRDIEHNEELRRGYNKLIKYMKPVTAL